MAKNNDSLPAVEQQIRGLLRSLARVSTVNRRPEFALFCLTILDLAEQGQVSRERAGFYIAETYGFDNIDDGDQLEEIIHQGLTVEVPEQCTDQAWARLRNLVAQLADEEEISI